MLIKLNESKPAFVIEDPIHMMFQGMKLQFLFGSFGIVVILQVLQKLLVQFLLSFPVNQLSCQLTPLGSFQVAQGTLNTIPVTIYTISAFSGDNIRASGLKSAAQIHKAYLRHPVPPIFLRGSFGCIPAKALPVDHQQPMANGGHMESSDTGNPVR